MIVYIYYFYLMLFVVYRDEMYFIFKVNDDVICIKIISENIILKIFKNVFIIENIC